MFHPWQTDADTCPNHELFLKHSKFTIDDYINEITVTSKDIGCINKYVNEKCKRVYECDEQDVNIKYQTCKTCKKVERPNYKKHDYMNSYDIYNDLHALVKHKHINVTCDQMCCIIFYNLCGQHNCNNHRRTHGCVNICGQTS